MAGSYLAKEDDAYMGGEEELIYRTNLFEGLFRRFNVMQIVRLGDFCIMFREGFQEGGGSATVSVPFSRSCYSYKQSCDYSYSWVTPLKIHVVVV